MPPNVTLPPRLVIFATDVKLTLFGGHDTMASVPSVGLHVAYPRVEIRIQACEADPWPRDRGTVRAVDETVD